ncbi:uncharacterized protein LOC109862764 [Pseudomyrmex gracilis]|uniref:uncharacterized protein LOC109862764 n=1 Tax=Pseudomyrmex gracilis TaxID=219809 RepID=UPI0009957B49|nr:uncharacterized protein LOC109862764 [Pseudomyrmex gracilis]
MRKRRLRSYLLAYASLLGGTRSGLLPSRLSELHAGRREVPLPPRSMVCARSSHPLGQLLKGIVETWEPICADNAFGLFTVYQELQHIVKDVAKFSLPGSLGLPYHVRFFKCDTDTNTGFLARRAENPQQYLEGFFRDHGLTRIFFTDRSLSPGLDETPPAVGFAVVSDEPDLVHYERINSSSTIFDAEARGVVCALEHLKDFGFPRVVIVGLTQRDYVPWINGP